MLYNYYIVPGFWLAFYPGLLTPAFVLCDKCYTGWEGLGTGSPAVVPNAACWSSAIWL